MSDTENETGSDVSHTSTAATKEQLYDYDQCISALEGWGVPEDLTSAAARCAVVRGLRCSYNFATSQQIQDFCTTMPQFPEFLRARNARFIMSNIIPDGLEAPEARPYCIWNPDFAAEDTYRQLAQRYQFMRYQVGRACAAAGYINLYRELDLLPDVSIAEEAREGRTEGGDQIYALIMSSPVKYAVMDDYTCSINHDSAQPALLDGETHVRWKLEWRYTLSEDATEDFEPEEVDIEEDQYIGLESSEPDISRYDKLDLREATLLWEPLPPDIPTMKKNVLCQMAAFDGNVDRYARLINRRSRTKLFKASVEILCVVRGIYHHTMFARWWQHQLDTNTFKHRIHEKERIELQTAINARRIMINDIGTFTEDTPCKPWLIWYPLKPNMSTLSTLAKRCPSMHTQIAITAIYCDCRDLYEQLNFQPHIGPMEAAGKVANPFYKQDLEKRAAELGITGIWKGDKRVPWVEAFDEIHGTLSNDLEPTGCGIYTRLSSDIMEPVHQPWYRSNFAYGGYFERFVWLSFETIRKMEIDLRADGGELVDNNDTRFYLTHEIVRDEEGNEVIKGSDVAE